MSLSDRMKTLSAKLFRRNKMLIGSEGTYGNRMVETMKKEDREESVEAMVRQDPIASEVRERWVASARSVDPMDDGERKAVRKLVRQLYEVEGRKPPPDERLVFAPSPFVTMVSAGLLSLYWSSQKTMRPFSKRSSDEIILARLRKYVANKLGNDASFGVYEPVSQACRQLGSMIGSAVEVGTDLMSAVITSDETMVSALMSAVQSDEVLEAIAGTCRSCSGEDITAYRPAATVEELGLNGAISLIGRTLDALEGGNIQAGISATVDYLEQTGFKVEQRLSLCSKIDALAGPRVRHPMFCVVSEKPEILKVNKSGRMHSAEGPACLWRDGTRLYCLDGVSVGSRFVEDPESTTVSHLEKMTAAQRAACFDIAPKREQVLLAIHMMEDEER